jgi:hypothetical protein
MKFEHVTTKSVRTQHWDKTERSLLPKSMKLTEVNPEGSSSLEEVPGFAVRRQATSQATDRSCAKQSVSAPEIRSGFALGFRRAIWESLRQWG